MIISNIKKQFFCDKNKLWDIITDNSNYKWRTDLSKIEIIDETHFIEYTPKIIFLLILLLQQKKNRKNISLI